MGTIGPVAVDDDEPGEGTPVLEEPDRDFDAGGGVELAPLDGAGVLLDVDGEAEVLDLTDGDGDGVGADELVGVTTVVRRCGT